MARLGYIAILGLLGCSPAFGGIAIFDPPIIPPPPLVGIAPGVDAVFREIGRAHV